MASKFAFKSDTKQALTGEGDAERAREEVEKGTDREVTPT